MTTHDDANIPAVRSLDGLVALRAALLDAECCAESLSRAGLDRLATVALDLAARVAAEKHAAERHVCAEHGMEASDLWEFVHEREMDAFDRFDP